MKKKIILYFLIFSLTIVSVTSIIKINENNTRNKNLGRALISSYKLYLNFKILALSTFTVNYEKYYKEDSIFSFLHTLESFADEYNYHIGTLSASQNNILIFNQLLKNSNLDYEKEMKIVENSRRIFKEVTEQIKSINNQVYRGEIKNINKLKDSYFSLKPSDVIPEKEMENLIVDMNNLIDDLSSLYSTESDTNYLFLPTSNPYQ